VAACGILAASALLTGCATAPTTSTFVSHSGASTITLHLGQAPIPANKSEPVTVTVTGPDASKVTSGVQVIATMNDMSMPSETFVLHAGRADQYTGSIIVVMGGSWTLRVVAPLGTRELQAAFRVTANE